MTRATVQTMPPAPQFERAEDFSLHMDAVDPLREFREQFYIPRARDGKERGNPLIYFAGNSLGLQPKSVRPLLEQELTDWAELGVDAHFDARTPWYPYHEIFRASGAQLVGAKPSANEVVMMNSLTVNLHLMMVSFYRPTASRYKILIEDPAFPSDVYAVKTHLRTRGFDPGDALVRISARPGEHAIRTEDLESLLTREGDSIALILLGGVNFFTGQALDMQRITELGHGHGCMVGFDLAHAAGNIPLRLHDWNVDFAAWCSYKYLNSGPGAVAGCFIHERHAQNVELPRYGGWWGNDPTTRFRMQLEPEFIPVRGADAWQLSNPPILSMAPLRASLDLFDRAGMDALRAKSLQLSGYLRFLLEAETPSAWEIITPREPDSQGAQLSILVHDRPRERFNALDDAGVACDFREPDVIRIAPVPLYNTFHEVWRFAQLFGTLV